MKGFLKNHSVLTKRMSVFTGLHEGVEGEEEETYALLDLLKLPLKNLKRGNVGGSLTEAVKKKKKKKKMKKVKNFFFFFCWG